VIPVEKLGGVQGYPLPECEQSSRSELNKEKRRSRGSLQTSKVAAEVADR